MKRIDCFPFRDELDLLECRLTEMDEAVDHFVLVEADRTHGHNRPKPLVYAEHADRFAAWSDRIVHVVASGMPDSPDAWDREHAQREWFTEGLARLDVADDDIVLQSDVDEIPTVLAAKHVQPRGFVVFEQRLHCFAVDWLHPQPWRGTVAARAGDITTMSAMRDAHLWAPTVLPEAGWHLSWLGGPEATLAKMRSFCHPEVEDLGWADRLEECYRDGLHLDNGRQGTPLIPVDVDDTWPHWIVEGHAPPVWFRPR